MLQTIKKKNELNNQQLQLKHPRSQLAVSVPE